MRGEAFESSENVWPAFSDLLAATTLLFVVLFAVITVPSIRRENALRGSQLRLDTLETLVKGRANGRYVTERLVDHLRITIGDNAVWRRNEFTLDQMAPAGRETLRVLATVLNGPEVREYIDQVHVVGHTSSEGDDSRNWELSSKRATTIALFLLADGGLPACLLTALGRGRYYPRDPDRAQRDRTPDARDRRIEIEIRPKVARGDSAQTRVNGPTQAPGSDPGRVSTRVCVETAGTAGGKS